MLAINKFIESTILEKIKELQDEQNQQFTAKIEPKFDIICATKMIKHF